MSLLAWPALLMLAAAGVLLALALIADGPRVREVGTLMIWRRIAGQSAPARSRRRLDPMLWLLLAAAVIGVFGAARPAVMAQDSVPRVAVYVERLDFTDDASLEAAVDRANEIAPDAELEFFAAAADGHEIAGMRRLDPGGLQSELARFRTLSGEHDGRLLMLARPWRETPDWARVAPLVDETRRGVIFEIRSEGSEIITRASAGGQADVEGADPVTAETGEGVTTAVYEGAAPAVAITDATGTTWRLRRDPFIVGVGPDWTSNAHRALYEALSVETADGDADVWLGSRDLTPAVRVNLGEIADLSGTTFGFDPRHSLFAELPLGSFDWARDGRVLPPDEDARALVTATRDGEVIGDVVRLRGRAVEFAGDPFTSAPIAAAALLLDNSIGVLTGEPPSRRAGYLLEDERLPTRRAAAATLFEPYGAPLPEVGRSREPVELASWLLAAAALMLGAAALWRARA